MKKATKSQGINWMEFILSTQGHEFYDKLSGIAVEKWLIDNTFNSKEIKKIIYNKHVRYGYRKTEKYELLEN